MFSQRRSHYWSQQSRTYSIDLLHRCVTPQLSLLLFRFVAFYYHMNFIAAFFFFKGFSAKQRKKPKKKEITTSLAKCIKRQLFGKYYKMFDNVRIQKWPVKMEPIFLSRVEGRGFHVEGRGYHVEGNFFFNISIKKMWCCCCCCLIKRVRGHSNSLKSKEPSPLWR